MGVGGIGGAAAKLAPAGPKGCENLRTQVATQTDTKEASVDKSTWYMDVEGLAEVVTLPRKSVFLCESYATFSMQCYYEVGLAGEIRTTLERAAAGPTAAEAR